MKVDRTIPAKASRNFGKPQSTVFFLGFVFLLYWSWPAVSLIHALSKHTFEIALEAQTLAANIKVIFKLYEPFRVRNVLHSVLFNESDMFHLVLFNKLYVFIKRDGEHVRLHERRQSALLPYTNDAIMSTT